jgi:hypothetical protein
MPNKRFKIPVSTQLKLWISSGGRCEFLGCNKIVWKDGLTLKEDNFAHIAHIIASSPNGPRGDMILSPKLQKEYSNLMLVCLKHSKLIDGKNSLSYTVEQLRSYKKKHEDRIKIQTAIAPEHSTTVLRFIADIKNRRMEASTAQVYNALDNRFPKDDKGIVIDYSGRVASFKNLAQEMSKQLKRDLAVGNDGIRHEHISIFALAPIPLLIHLGNRIGNLIPGDLYQKHRDTDDWKWKIEPKSDRFEYSVSRSNFRKKSKNIVLILSLSGKVHAAEYQNLLLDCPIFEIATKELDTSFLPYRSRLEKFRKIYRQILSEIRTKYGDDCTVHLFPAIPAPVAVLCGKELIPKSDPTLIIYDNDKVKGGFIKTLTIN